MNHFIGLPWRVAALAGLLVGGISLLSGAGPWTCLVRVALAFAVFAAAGFGLQFVLLAEPPPAPGRSQPAPPEDSPDEPASTTETH
jgi:hypothetical protein